jgi:hypothetical protein
MLKPRRSAVAFAAAFLAAHGALAFEGRYIKGDKANRQELEIKKRAEGGFDLTAVVEAEDCRGYVDARGEACPGSEVQNAPNEPQRSCRSCRDQGYCSSIADRNYVGLERQAFRSTMKSGLEEPAHSPSVSLTR